MTWEMMTQAFWSVVGNVGRRMVEASDERMQWRTPIERLDAIIRQDRERARREGLRLRMDA